MMKRTFRPTLEQLEDRLAPSFAGSLFTSTVDGSSTNGNTFADKADVYIRVGNSNQGNVPNGDYFFQVTDPNGSTLLSTDAITEREAHVTGGVFDAYLGSTHATGVSIFGGIVVGLFPFSTTPNPSGVYKVWLTPVADYNPGDKNSNFGFVNNDSKTDNFKVVEPVPPPTFTLSGVKYEDHNGDAVQEAQDQGLAGWHILVNGVDMAVTDANGNWSVSGLAANQSYFV